MARIRTLKPETLDDEKVADLTDPAWRLWVSSILLADDYGNLRANRRVLAGRVFPYPKKGRPTVQTLIEELEKAGLLLPYEVRNQSYLNHPNWRKHQRIDNPGKPRVPGPSEASGKSSKKLLDFPPDPDPDPEHRNIGPSSKETAAVFAAYQGYHSRAKFSADREKRILKQLRAGFSAQQLIGAIHGIHRDRWHVENGKCADLLYTLRSADHIEKFSALAKRQPISEQNLQIPKFENRVDKLGRLAMEAEEEDESR